MHSPWFLKMPNAIQPPFLHSSDVVGTNGVTVTVNPHCVVNPDASVAVATTGVVPTANVLPDAGL